MTPILMVAIEGVCLAFLLVILAACIFLPHSKKIKNNWFLYCLLLTFAAVAFDLVSWFCETVPSPEWLQFTSNYLSVIMTAFIISTFSYYTTDMISEKKPISRNYARIISIVNLLGITVTSVAAFSGKMFAIRPDTVNPEIRIYDSANLFYELPMIISTLSLIFLFALVLINAKSLGRQRIAVLSIYFVLPLLTGVVEILDDDMQLSYVFISVSMSIVYVMLQSNHMNELLLREKLLQEISYVDQLTGLLNRRACDRDVDLIQIHDTVGIVFCDLNGLKKVNDEKGHHAGDLYLLRFTDIISRYFPHESIYRISGDEFVVVQRNMDKDTFESSVEALREDIRGNDKISSVGMAIGSGEEFRYLIKTAEERMYVEKKEYYLLHSAAPAEQ